MIVAAAQTRPEFGDREGNLRRAFELAGDTKADLIVFPELFGTGYLFESREELEGFAERLDGPTAAALKGFSREKRCAVYGGFPELEEAPGRGEGKRVYNTCALAVEGELAAVYRKLHLFIDEKSIFDRSQGEPLVLEAAGARLGMMICFDWVFPEMARSLALLGAQVLCLSANLVLPFCQQAMITRSIENGVFTVLCNRVGAERRAGKELCFTGLSEIIGPRGELLARASGEEEEVIAAEIDPAMADDKWITPRNHLFEDRRLDLYHLGDPVHSD